MNSLPLNKQQIAWRKQVAFDKTKSVIHYITSEKTCRTRMIQDYFDEAAEEDCGVCDNCLNRKKLQQWELPTEEILAMLHESSLTYDEIKSALIKYAPVQIEQAVRHLLEMNQIILKDEKYFRR